MQEFPMRLQAQVYMTKVSVIFLKIRLTLRKGRGIIQEKREKFIRLVAFIYAGYKFQHGLIEKSVKIRYDPVTVIASRLHYVTEMYILGRRGER